MLFVFICLPDLSDLAFIICHFLLRYSVFVITYYLSESLNI